MSPAHGDEPGRFDQHVDIRSATKAMSYHARSRGKIDDPFYVGGIGRQQHVQQAPSENADTVGCGEQANPASMPSWRRRAKTHSFKPDHVFLTFSGHSSGEDYTPDGLNLAEREPHKERIDAITGAA